MQQKTGQQSSGLGKKGLCGSLSICTRTSEQEVSTSSLRGLWRKGKCFPLEGQQYHLPETGPRCSQPSGPGLFGAWSPQCGTSVPQQVLWDEHDSWSPQGVTAATFVQGVCQVQESRGTRSFRFRDLQACRAKKKKKKTQFSKTKSLCNCLIYSFDRKGNQGPEGFNYLAGHPGFPSGLTLVLLWLLHSHVWRHMHIRPRILCPADVKSASRAWWASSLGHRWCLISQAHVCSWHVRALGKAGKQWKEG